VFLSHDPSALDDLVAENCRVENSQPAPDGSVHVGKEACIALWSGIAASAHIRFEPEQVEARGDLGIITWKLYFGEGARDWVRGVNIMRVADGRIVEGRGYVKAG
jgi:hypothetical protein